MKATKAREDRLSNGLRVIHLHTTNDPISAAHLFIPGGAGLEPPTKAGISILMWALLLKGTNRRTARQIAEDIESIGAGIGGGATHDYSEVSCHSVSEYFMPSLEIMSELLLQPAFPAAEVEKERNAMIAAIRARKENIFSIASLQLNKRLYGKHVYGRPASGFEETVAPLTRANLEDWHKKVIFPDQGVLTIASNIPFKELRAELERLFGQSVWKRSKKSAPKLSAPRRPTKPMFAQEKHPFEQAYLLIGYPAPPVDSPDYIPLKLFTTYLGGGMSARLFQELREKHGLAYDVGAFYASKKSGSALVIYMGLQLSRLPEARRRIDATLEDLRAKGISRRNLAETKSYLKGTYILDHQTNGQRAHYLGWWKTLGLGTAFDTAYLRATDRVTVEMANRAARRVFSQPPVVIEIHPTKERKGAPAQA